MKKILIILSLAMFSVSILSAVPKKNNEFQRSSKGVFDKQKNTKSNVELISTNYGMQMYDYDSSQSAFVWPRGSQNAYISGGGFWFGAKKEVDGTLRKMVSVSYNPNSGSSWYIPGRIEDGDLLIKDETKKYRVYYSTDFDNETGQVTIPNDGPDWPLWIADNSGKVQYGVYKHEYIYNAEDRNLSVYPSGHMILSDEHIFSTYKDTQLDRYEGGMAARAAMGYPLKLQVEENSYTWESGDMKDVVILSYSITNNSEDTYTDCWFSPVMDFDIALQTSISFGAANDRVNYYMEDDELNLVYAWTETDKGEEGQGFGYVGFSMLESPAVDENRDLRHDKLIFDPSEQIGIKTFQNWNIQEDILYDDERYDFLSQGVIDGDTCPGDKRLLMATGPFNLKPGETARLAIGISFAMPAKGGEADGTLEDITGFTEGKVKNNFQAVNTSLVGKQEKMQEEYYYAVYNSVNNYIDMSDDAVYPNPASNMINVKYQNQSAGNVRISLVNTNGIEVAELSNSFKTMGYHTDNYLLGNINSGMYILKIETSNVVYTKKLLISR